MSHPPTLPTPEASTTESPDQELARLQAEREKRRAKPEADGVAHALALERLRAQLDEKVGEEGKDYMIYDATAAGAGVFAVKRGPAVTYTNFLEGKSQGHEAKVKFVAANIAHPSREDFMRAIGERPGLVLELTNRLAKLFGLNIEIQEGK